MQKNTNKRQFGKGKKTKKQVFYFNSCPCFLPLQRLLFCVVGSLVIENERGCMGNEFP